MSGGAYITAHSNARLVHVQWATAELLGAVAAQVQESCATCGTGLLVYQLPIREEHPRLLLLLAASRAALVPALERGLPLVQIEGDAVGHDAWLSEGREQCLVGNPGLLHAG